MWNHITLQLTNKDGPSRGRIPMYEARSPENDEFESPNSGPGNLKQLTIEVPNQVEGEDLD